jgi:methylenetetrahydrofolate reductase (NADPH)
MAQVPVPNLYKEKKNVISVEFFPPKKIESLDKAKENINAFSPLNVDYMTVTYGAGGSTTGLTFELLSHIVNVLKKPAVSHLTCYGQSLDEIILVLDQLKEIGINNILALRGDVRPDISKKAFECARDLTKFIDSKYNNFSILTAGYPEVHRDAISPKADLSYLKEKVDSGAKAILTQLFFDNQTYFRFVDNCLSAGINVPVVPGILPVRDFSQLKKFTSMCGATIPEDLAIKLEAVKDNLSDTIKVGTEYALNQCLELMQNKVPGIHFYSLNHSHQVEEILSGLKF